ncbi:MAG: hypothetical protein QNJ98_16240 [Planctomycetota bacterium]|nr:hypothetical protein [Planctomycetota bacterium]
MIRRLSALIVAALVIASGVGLGRAEDESMAKLRHKLMFAQGDRQVRAALDALAERIGQEPGFKDAGAFGDWLKALPSGRNRLGPVLQRIGWAYVAMKRGPEAIEPLEASLKDDPSQGATRAYLAEAFRQTGRHLDALKMVATALRTAYDEPHMRETVMSAAAALRKTQEAKDATGLPGYAEGLRDVLRNSRKPDPKLHSTLARWLLWDLEAYDKPTTERGRLWARTAAEHALTAVDTTTELLPASQRLTFDAAVALEAVDKDAYGDSERFDLLVHAVRLGEALADGGPHLIPQAFTHLAEAAADEGRYELAWRLAQKRLDISFSPRAVRLMRRLPPDLGD